MERVRVRAVEALEDALVGVSGRSALGSDKYAVALQANLLYPMSLETQADFAAGARRELDRSMRAPALVLSARRKRFRAVAGSSAATGTGRGPLLRKDRVREAIAERTARDAPHLDLVAESGDAVVAVESKCLEYLTPEVPHFRPSYQTLGNVYGRRSWFRYVAEAPTSSLHLNIAQLVKHWLGLCQNYPDRRVTLLYLYWEPENWQQVPECCRHRREHQDFADRVTGDAVRFAASSYPELWTNWGNKARPLHGLRSTSLACGSGTPLPSDEPGNRACCPLPMERYWSSLDLPVAGFRYSLDGLASVVGVEFLYQRSRVLAIWRSSYHNPLRDSYFSKQRYGARGERGVVVSRGTPEIAVRISGRSHRHERIIRVR